MNSGIIRTVIVLLASILLAAAQSCLKDRPEILPENLVWNPELAFPLGDQEFGMNSSSGFDTILYEPDTLSGFPVWIYETEVVLEGNLDFDLGTISDNMDQVSRVLFRINIYNQFPHTVLSQAYFRDEADRLIDSIFLKGPAKTPPGTLDRDGSSLQEGYSRHDALIEEDRLSPLADAQSILFRSTLNLEDLDTLMISFYPDLNMDLQTGILLDLSLDY
jgi:hypothetical protein